jgi:hypothetical protein
MRVPAIMRKLRYHVADANTVGLWNGFANKNDSSGNNFTLTLGGGTERYAEVGHGLLGFLLDGSSYYKRTGNDAALNLAGDMTIEAIVRPLAQPGGLAAAMIAGMGVAATDAGANDNYYWAMYAGNATVGGNPNYTGVVSSSFFYEQGAGVNVQKDSATYRMINEPQHWAWVRTGTALKAYLNGFQQGADFTGLTLGTVGGAPTQKFSLGGSDTGTELFTGVIASVKISNVARSSGYIQKDAARCLGIGAGIVDGASAP